MPEIQKVLEGLRVQEQADRIVTRIRKSGKRADLVRLIPYHCKEIRKHILELEAIGRSLWKARL